jgi:Fe-S cluster assembly protein SufD
MSGNNKHPMVDQLKVNESIISPGLRDKVLKDIESANMPTTRVENWKYTRVAKLNKLPFQTGTVSSIDITPFEIIKGAPTLVFVNGQFAQSSNLEKVEVGVHLAALSQTNETISNSLINTDDELFNALNIAYLNDGVRIQVDKNTQCNETLQIIHILDGDTVISNFKTIIELGDFAELNVVQSFFSTEDTTDAFCNTSTEITAGNNAILMLDKLQYENETCYHISSEQIDQDANSTVTVNTVTLNGRLVRNNLNFVVNGQNATSNLNGAYILKGNQHVDNHTVVDHKVANCNSNELYKGVMDEKSTGVFNGKVFVRQDAQKINAFQSNGNILLSDDATINSKPELEIYADDVKCSHGSTTGQLDNDAVFYLRARGLSEKSAKRLLVRAFIDEALEAISSEDFHAYVNRCLEERFDWSVN